MALEQVKTSTAKEANREEIAALRAEIVQATRDGELEKAEELRDKLADLRAPKVPAALPPQPNVEELERRPEWIEFVDQNPWWRDDPPLRAAAGEIAKEMERKGELLPATPPRERLSRIAEEVKERYMSSRRTEPARVAATRSVAPRQNGKTYADLPADAKAACDSFTDRVVGPKMKFKDVASWQKSYAEKYFEER
jgi:hypothetical protein